MSGTDETIAMGGGDQTMAAGGPPAQGGGGGQVDDGGEARKWWLIPLVILVVGVVIGGGIAIAGGGDGDDETADSTSTSSSSSTTIATQGSGGGSSSGGGGGGTTTTTATNDDPKIDSLATSSGSPATCTPDNPMGFDSPTDPYNVTVSWSTSNATQTVLSVDGPGEYGTYGAAASVNFSFGCSGSQTHTFMITAKGPNGPDATRTISFTINQGP
jgi:hypothetical protein